MLKKIISVQSQASVRLFIPFTSIDDIISSRVLGTTMQPRLISPDQIEDMTRFQRFQNKERKHAYREQLLGALNNTWSVEHGEEIAEQLRTQFLGLVDELDQKGAVVFSKLMTTSHFQQFVSTYDHVMDNHGSEGLLHSYLNLRNHPDFIGDPSLNRSIIHPLLITLLSYHLGDAVRVVDVRGKDANPIHVRAQDNMLHIDNTPFRFEYKIILTWKKNTTDGPSGQNFVYLPGTQKGVRDVHINHLTKNAWSTENGSIFITPEHVEQVFQFQEDTIGQRQVVEVNYAEAPTTTLFQAGALVHHRYRTQGGDPRSCVILAFHGVHDNPGVFIPTHALEEQKSTTDVNSSLEDLLFYPLPSTDPDYFQNQLLHYTEEITEKLIALAHSNEESTIVPQNEITMTRKKVNDWKKVATNAPDIQELKRRKQYFPYNVSLTRNELAQMISENLMHFDKHGPLNLILYEDGHEEIRKWARNKVREVKTSFLTDRILRWSSHLDQTQEQHILTVEDICGICDDIQNAVLAHNTVQGMWPDPQEKITQDESFRSISQLNIDLKEAIQRCDSFQNFLSTSLFIFLNVDLAVQGMGSEPDRYDTLVELGGHLLRHYVASAVLEHANQERQKRIAHDVSNTPAPFLPSLIFSRISNVMSV